MFQHTGDQDCHERSKGLADFRNTELAMRDQRTVGVEGPVPRPGGRLFRDNVQDKGPADAVRQQRLVPMVRTAQTKVPKDKACDTLTDRVEDLPVVQQELALTVQTAQLKVPMDQASTQWFRWWSSCSSWTKLSTCQSWCEHGSRTVDLQGNRWRQACSEGPCGGADMLFKADPGSRTTV